MSSIDSSGTTAWQAAFLEATGKAEEHKVLQLLEECGPRTERVRDALRVALQKVVGRGHEALTRLLLREGAEVNDVRGKEVPPLCRAAELGRDKIVRILLENGANTEVKGKEKRTPIFAAALKGHYTTIKLLIEAGANVNARDENKQNLLLCLASAKSEKHVKVNSEVVDTLLDTNINVESRDKDGRTALLWASALGKRAFVMALLTCRKPVDVNAANDRGKTALHFAAGNNQSEIVQLLLQHGASPQARSDGGWVPLHNAADKGHVEVLSLLLQWSVDVNATTSSGTTALHWAARNGHIDAVELLLNQEGIKRNGKDSLDKTPMLGAAESGHLEIVKILSPADDGKLLSIDAHGACTGFQANVVDFGMERRYINHIKYSVFDLLYGQDQKRHKPIVTTIVRNIPAKPKFRWIHLPANNMTWVETLITKQFVENGASDVEGFRALEKTFGQKHAGPMIHSHFMRPHCSRMSPGARNPTPIDMTESTTETLVNDAGSIVTTTFEKVSPANNVTPIKTNKRGTRRGGKDSKGLNSTPPSTQWNTFKRTNSLATESTVSFNGEAGAFERTRTPSQLPNRKPERNGNIVMFVPYLHYETDQRRVEMSNAIKRTQSKLTEVSHKPEADSCDEQLVNAYLHSTHNLHIRRTLDQSYYHAISTEERDQDQVVYRYTRDKKQEVKVFMVDQLWMWILDKDLIVTCFPQRWKQPKNDPLNVLDGIIEDMSGKTQSQVNSVYDLAMLITGRCCGVFDRHRLGGEEYQFLDMFESSIGEVTEKETKLFEKFNVASVRAARWLRRRRHQSKDETLDLSDAVEEDLETDPTFVDTLLDIGEETQFLAETKDIRDELNMISMVLKHQLSIQDDLHKALLEELKGNHNHQRQAEIKKRFREQQKLVENHLKDVERMDKQAEGIYTSLTHLLDLKQKHANAFEARFARDQAVFTGRQGQTIMVFTIVTAVFLPMSFIASIFAVPLREFPRTSDGVPDFDFNYMAKFVFGIGLAISIPSIAVAFAVDDIRTWLRLFVGGLFPARGKSKNRPKLEESGRNRGTYQNQMADNEVRKQSVDACGRRKSYERQEVHVNRQPDRPETIDDMYRTPGQQGDLEKGERNC